VAVRYVPLVVVLVALALVITLVPRADQNGNRTRAAAGRAGSHRVFKMAQPNGEPKSSDQYFDVNYTTVLYVFNALPAAGPNLTPETLQRGIFSLPTSQLGDYDTWSYGPGAFSPGVDAQIGYWDPNATSPWDNKKGAWQSCDGGAWVRFTKPESFGPDHTQTRGFGR
jgi:hypothetical protein